MRALSVIVLLLLACATSGVAKPKQGEPCDANGKCTRGLTCVRYYGVAGPRGPAMTSCEIPCADGGLPDFLGDFALRLAEGQDPENQTCNTIADGPGQVCRPAGNR